MGVQGPTELPQIADEAIVVELERDRLDGRASQERRPHDAYDAASIRDPVSREYVAGEYRLRAQPAGADADGQDVAVERGARDVQLARAEQAGNGGAVALKQGILHLAGPLQIQRLGVADELTATNIRPAVDIECDTGRIADEVGAFDQGVAAHPQGARGVSDELAVANSNVLEGNDRRLASFDGDALQHEWLRGVD